MGNFSMLCKIQRKDNNNLSTFTHNKSIQKIIESTRVDKETKEELKKLKK